MTKQVREHGPLAKQALSTGQQSPAQCRLLLASWAEIGGAPGPVAASRASQVGTIAAGNAGLIGHHHHAAVADRRERRQGLPEACRQAGSQGFVSWEAYWPGATGSGGPSAWLLTLLALKAGWGPTTTRRAEGFPAARSACPRPGEWPACTTACTAPGPAGPSSGQQFPPAALGIGRVASKALGATLVPATAWTKSGVQNRAPSRAGSPQPQEIQPARVAQGRGFVSPAPATACCHCTGP